MMEKRNDAPQPASFETSKNTKTHYTPALLAHPDLHPKWLEKLDFDTPSTWEYPKSEDIREAHRRVVLDVLRGLNRNEMRVVRNFLFCADDGPWINPDVRPNNCAQAIVRLRATPLPIMNNAVLEKLEPRDIGPLRLTELTDVYQDLGAAARSELHDLLLKLFRQCGSEIEFDAVRALGIPLWEQVVQDLKAGGQ